jgi:hypothetical protein
MEWRRRYFFFLADINWNCERFNYGISIHTCKVTIFTSSISLSYPTPIFNRKTFKWISLLNAALVPMNRESFLRQEIWVRPAFDFQFCYLRGKESLWHSKEKVNRMCNEYKDHFKDRLSLELVTFHPEQKTTWEVSFKFEYSFIVLKWLWKSKRIPLLSQRPELTDCPKHETAWYKSCSTIEWPACPTPSFPWLVWVMTEKPDLWGILQRDYFIKN